jgi:hypothetical protein
MECLKDLFKQMRPVWVGGLQHEGQKTQESVLVLLHDARKNRSDALQNWAARHALAERARERELSS